MNYTIDTKHSESKNLWEVVVTGEIDIFNSNEFKQILNDCCKEKQSSIVIECRELDYIDSTGLGALVAILKSVKIFDGTVTLLNLKPNLLKLFKITNMDKIFIIEGDEVER